MERAFEWDLSAVRVHAGPEGERFTSRLRARAATLGSNVFFGPREYQPGTTEGKRLLAHELAHVVQQAGGARNPGGPVEPEQAAELASDAVVRGSEVPFGLRASPSHRPALQQANWSQQVSAAQAHTNLAQRSTAMVALVRQALGTTLTVHEAPVNSSVQLEQADYHSPPEINFDVRLNQKQRRSTPGQGGATPPLLSNNVGYTFHTGSGAARRGYSILGPMVLGTGGEGYVRMYADHELYHATHHSLFQGSNADMELEAWTDTFRRHFVAMAPQRQAWTPLITYYEGATTSARATALAALRAFAQGLPATAAPGATESDRSRFDAWLRRRLNDPQTQTKALVVDLALALGVAVTPPPAPSQNAQPPNGPSPTPP